MRQPQQRKVSAESLAAVAMKALSLDPERVLSQILDLVRKELSVSRCAVLLLDRSTNELVLRHSIVRCWIGLLVPAGCVSR